MNYCPQCGSPLTSENIKFCPECGCNLKALQRVDMECPDCGMVFDRQAIPNECPTCGCPSERFKVHEDDAEINAELITTPENEQPENEQPKKVSIKPFLITLLFVIVGCLFIYYAGQPKEGRIIGPTTLVENEEQAAEERTSETVYQGSEGTEIIICDNGIAYLNGTKGTWRKSSVTIGNSSHNYIQINQNGLFSQGAICEGKFYYGFDAHTAVKEGWPDGEPLTRSRR